MNIVPQEHWDIGYKDFVIQKAPDNDPITKLLKKHIPVAKAGEQAFEIGCFPGRFLCVLGDLGYTLNGIDTTPYVNDFAKSLNALGYKTNNIENTKFEDAPTGKYDIVASFGFIEHFIDWEVVIKKHTEFLNKEGYLVITTPNFKGLLQYLYHRLVDNDNLKRHVVPSMSPKKWKTILELRGLEVIANGYIGHEFWDESNRRDLFYRGLKKITRKVFNLIHYLKPNTSATGSYCYIIAKYK